MLTPRISAPRSIRLGLALAAPALLVAACGGSSGYTGSQASSTTSKSAASTVSQGTTVATHKGALGTYLTDGSGRTLYLFMADHGTTSTCTGACASAWPPYLGKGAPTTAGTAQKSMLGTTSRGDGSKQVTYGGHPLYYFAGDSAAGDTNGQGVNGFGALWWVVSPAGSAITHSSGSSSSTSGSSTSGSSTSGGYSRSGGGGY